MKTWWKVVGVLLTGAVGLAVYADWTDDVGAKTLAYFVAALGLTVAAYRLWVKVMDGRAENEGALQRGVFAAVAVAVFAAVLAGTGLCRPT